MRLIDNGTESGNHLTVLDQSLRECDEAWLAAAFLKRSGLATLRSPLADLLARGGRLTVLAGLNFGLTEPEALRGLYQMFAGHPAARLYLARAESAAQVFHPKIYLFKFGRKYRIIAGSANLTDGGLRTNREISLALDGNTGEEIWGRARALWDEMTAPGNAEEGTLLAIDRYEAFYQAQRKANAAAKAVSPGRADWPFNYDRLKARLAGFDRAELAELFAERAASYQLAREVLDEIADSRRLTDGQFRELLDRLIVKPHYWYSDGLQRGKTSVYRHRAEFRRLVRHIRGQAGRPASEVFTEGRRLIEPIKGASVNFLTEIMITYHPERFAVLNKRPVDVLREDAGAVLKKNPRVFTGDDYEKYCGLISEIAAQLGLADLLEADAFFDRIYQRLKAA